MIQNKSTFQKQQLGQQLTQTLGQPLSEQELSNCLQQIEILEPNAGKLFWEAADATVGIYVILAGKVRLLNSTDNLIASVGVGASFGELTLFPESGFQAYTARASVNLKVCYIPGDCLRSLIRKYPSIGQHLNRQALLWDLLLLCRQTPYLADAPVEGLMQILPLLEQHNLQVGKLPSSLLKDQQLWLLRRGELLHTSGCKLTVGNIYALEQLPKERSWQVTQPSQIYSLSALLKDAKEASTPFWQFFELAKPHWLVLLEVFIASILLQIFGLITPLFTQLLLDRVVVQRSDLTLTAVGIGLLIFSLFRVAMTGLRQYLLDHTANRVDLALIVGFISHTFRLPLNYFESRYVGDIISRVQENRKIQRFLTGEALSIVLDLLTVFIYVGLMFWYSWKMALLVLVIVPPFVLLALIATPFLQRVSREIFSAYNEETGYLIQSLTGIRTIKSMAVEQSVRWKWEEFFGKSIKKNFSGQVIGNTLQIFSSGIEAVVSTILLWFGAWQVIQNELTIGQLVAFNMLLGNVINPFQRLIMLWNELQEVLIAVERINDVIDAEPEEDLHSSSRQSLPPIRGYIAFDKVTFRYHPESDVNTLENISFEVRPGQMIALVGRSGSGKTTISKLVLGLYPPTEGKILIDGYDVTTLSLRSLRSQIGVVDQDTFLFGGTIRENISLGYPEATLEEVIEAAQQAGAHEFIKELPMGYETQIGEGGGTLSGGQRQRLAIARALVGNPQLLILDEATSSLDAESERIIQTNLNKILQDRTTLVIAHRLSTVRNADKILVLDRGLLVESGTHDELMAKRGHYFYLNQQQLTIAI
ncbi:ABCB-BAC, ATP-binding cassette, subfamily B, bacterial [Nostoc flagelliforme CCNUN1]|uniref:ABCB-BAC, ATP-binding cassette, subfamily B, bacterial n=1 Tax=Nostoc flagelliforme CCNUN1 TaxID=2038116 RepID=A0A2K8SHT4_9NOSO|nr:peptidase domain-containing ABC transporter [Nostoc flagelliforme]AUB35009.1 ABCB-BAC, ATP-binding cassette, subfamily B, bacterial [Nostoc flagelliforme CCNUN1]